MTDIVKRLRDADTTRRIGESYADTHERRQRDRDEAAAEIERLRAGNRDLLRNKLYTLMMHTPSHESRPETLSRGLAEGLAEAIAEYVVYAVCGNEYERSKK